MHRHLNPTKRELDRFNRSVTRMESGCWICSLSPSGVYSRTSIAGVKMMGHVFALSLKLGRPLREGYKACHSCNTPRCVNPDHLWEGTQAENVRHMVESNRCVRRFGDEHHSTLLKDADVVFIREALASGSKTIKELAEMFGVTFQAVWGVAHGIRAANAGGPILKKKPVRSLTAFEVIQVRSLAASGVTGAAIAKSIGNHPATISNIISGRKRRDVDFLLPQL